MHTASILQNSLVLPRAPSQLEEAAKRMAGKQPDDDGRVVKGRTLSGPEARQGRYWPFITGFPFPLGPVLTRQTVRHEVGIPTDRACGQGAWVVAPACESALCRCALPRSPLSAPSLPTLQWCEHIHVRAAQL